jgi:hypothetical protein
MDRVPKDIVAEQGSQERVPTPGQGLQSLFLTTCSLQLSPQDRVPMTVLSGQGLQDCYRTGPTGQCSENGVPGQRPWALRVSTTGCQDRVPRAGFSGQNLQSGICRTNNKRHSPYYPGQVVEGPGISRMPLPSMNIWDLMPMSQG